MTAARMYQLGIFTGRDLKEKTMEFLKEHFKSSGEHYYRIVRGLYHSEVCPDRIQKSVAAEHTFTQNLTSEIYMMERLQEIADELEARLRRSDLSGKTVTLKIRYSDFSLQTRSKTLPDYVRDKAVLVQTVRELLYQEKLHESVRLLGISVSNLDNVQEDKEPVINVQLRFEF